MNECRLPARYSALRCLLLTLPWLLLPSVTDTHPQTDGIGGLVSGFLHPLMGLDHIVAMGLWGAYLGAPAM